MEMTSDEKRTMEWHSRRIADIKSWRNGLAFHFFEKDHVKWKEFHDYVVEEILKSKFNLTPHRGLAHGENFSDTTHTMSYKGLKKKLEKFNFKNLESLDFTVMLPNTKDVSDFIAECFLYAKEVPDNNRSKLCFLIDDELQSFDLDFWVKVGTKFYELTKAPYGYYFKYPFNCNPTLYPFGDDNISTEIEEYRRNRKWERFRFANGLNEYIRDIYRLNFLNEHHLSLMVDDKINLKQWIKSGNEDERGTLKQINDDFYYWHVEEKNIAKIRQDLSKSGFIVCVFD
jgi:hypothetical protein